MASAPRARAPMASAPRARAPVLRAPMEAAPVLEVRVVWWVGMEELYAGFGGIEDVTVAK